MSPSPSPPTAPGAPEAPKKQAGPPGPRPPGVAWAGLVLLFLQLGSFGVFAGRLGFYHDDWPMLELGLKEPGLAGAIRSYAGAGLWSRPLEIIQYPLCISLCGLSPSAYQLLMLCLRAAESILLFLLLKRLLLSPSLALSAAGLAAMFPNRFAVHVWFANSPQTVAQILVLLSLWLHMLWIERRLGNRLLLGQAAYLAGMLSYESCAFMPLLLAGGLLARRVGSGAGWVRSAARTAGDLSPYAVTLAAVLSWQWGWMRLLPGAVNPKAALVKASWTHLFKAYGAGFECLTNRVLHACWLGALQAKTALSPSSVLAWAAFTSAAVLLLRRREGAEKYPPALGPALGAAAAGFVGAYAPYALSGAYMPHLFGIMSRTNGAGAWIGGLLLACALSAVPSPGWARRGSGRPLQALALGAAVGAFTWTNWGNGRQWAQAWREQKRILQELSTRLPRVSGPGTILLTGTPAHVGHAVVFDAPYDFDAALRLWTGRGDLHGNIVTSRFRFESGGAVETRPDGTELRYGAGGLYLYHADRGILEALPAP